MAAQQTLTLLVLVRTQVSQPVAMVFQMNAQVVFELQPFKLTNLTEQKQTALTLELLRATIP